MRPFNRANFDFNESPRPEDARTGGSHPSGSPRDTRKRNPLNTESGCGGTEARRMWRYRRRRSVRERGSWKSRSHLLRRPRFRSTSADFQKCRWNAPFSESFGKIGMGGCGDGDPIAHEASEGVSISPETHCAMTLLEVDVRKGSETPQLKNTGPMLEIMPGMEARYRLPNSCVGPQPCEPCGGENIAKSSKDRGCLAQWLSLVVNILRLIVEVFR